jgi:hypothetical protein
MVMFLIQGRKKLGQRPTYNKGERLATTAKDDLLADADAGCRQNLR